MTPKSEYIIAISELSDHYGNYLVELMDKCHVSSLAEVTEEQAKEFLQELQRREQQWNF